MELHCSAAARELAVGKKKQNCEILLKLLRSVYFLVNNRIPYSTMYPNVFELQIASSSFEYVKLLALCSGARILCPCGGASLDACRRCRLFFRAFLARARVTASLLRPHGAIPASTGSGNTGVDFRQPIMVYRVLLMAHLCSSCGNFYTIQACST